jgi:hypothetical protein
VISPAARRARGFYPFVSRRFYRPVGLPPEKETLGTTTRINETVDRSVFERWRVDENYLPPEHHQVGPSGTRSNPSN